MSPRNPRGLVPVVAALAVVVVVSTALALLARGGDGRDGADGSPARAGDAAAGDGAEAGDVGGRHGEGDGDVGSDGSDDAGGGDDTDPSGDDAESGDGSALIRMSTFWSAGATVEAGSTVTVLNDTTPPQSFTAEDGSFDTGELRGEERAVMVAPSTPGSYVVISTSDFGEGRRATLVVT